MKKFFLCSILILFINTTGATERIVSCENKASSLQLQIISDRSRVALNESFSISVTILNLDDKLVELAPFMELESYWLRFQVVDEKNHQVRWLGPEVKMIEDSKRVSLHKGYFWGRKFNNFQNLYKISKLGKYRITAVYGFSPDGDCPLGKLTSNTIDLIVN